MNQYLAQAVQRFVQLKLQQPASVSFPKLRFEIGIMLLNLRNMLTNTESVSLFSQANLDNSLKREWADIFSRHIIRGMGVGLLLYSSSRYSRTCLLNGLRCHAS